VIHELMITLFVVMTAPVTAMMLARAAIYRRERRGQSSNGGGDADASTAGAQHEPESGG
jgi:multicomponent K+:H+ antiporter subunit G